MNDQRALVLANPNTTSQEDDDDDGTQSPTVRDIHALTPPPAPRAVRHREAWETSSHRSSSLSVGSTATEGGENFNSMSREFNALVLAGSAMDGGGENRNLGRIREEDQREETNPLAIVPEGSYNPSPPRLGGRGGDEVAIIGDVAPVQRVKKEEVESKITAWQNAKISKINNRFKRDDAIINGWEGEQVHKANSWMKKIERKLEEKRAKAYEKMQNDIAKAHRKAEERRASSEAKRGTKVAKILEIANLMRAVGRPPVKRSFF